MKKVNMKKIEYSGHICDNCPNCGYWTPYKSPWKRICEWINILKSFLKKKK